MVEISQPNEKRKNTRSSVTNRNKAQLQNFKNDKKVFTSKCYVFLSFSKTKIILFSYMNRQILYFYFINLLAETGFCAMLESSFVVLVRPLFFSIFFYTGNWGYWMTKTHNMHVDLLLLNKLQFRFNLEDRSRICYQVIKYRETFIFLIF